MSGDEGSGGLAPSPYVHGKFNASYSYGKRQGNQSGRHRPQTKALRVAKHQALDFDVPSLAAQGASAAGPPQARFIGRGQLDRETPTETTTCKHAIAQLQNIVEPKLLAACNAALPAAAAALEQDGTRESAALAAAARDAEFLPKRFPYEAFDFYLRMGQEFYGLALRHRLAKVKQHWQQPQQERHFFKAQRAVVEHGQLAVLSTGYSLRALAASELPPRAAQLGSDFQEELEAFEEEQGLETGQLTVQEIEAAADDLGGYYFDAKSFPKCDNCPDFVVQLLKKTLLVKPLQDTSAVTGLKHPHRFSSPQQEQAARLIEQAERVLHPLPPGWELLHPAMEGYGAVLCIVPPPDTQMQSMGLKDGLRLALAGVSLERLLGMVQLAAASVGAPVAAALSLLQAEVAGRPSVELAQAIEVVQRAAAASEAWVVQQYKDKAAAAAAAAAAALTAAAETDDDDEEAPPVSKRPRRSQAAPPSAPPAPSERFEWTLERVAQFDAALERLGKGLAATPGEILPLMSDPKINRRILQSYVQKRRQREQGIVGGRLPRPSPPPWAAAAGISSQAGDDSSAATAAATAGAAAGAAWDDSSAAQTSLSPLPSSACTGAAAMLEGPAVTPSAVDAVDATAAPPAVQRGVLGLPAGTLTAFASRVKGDAPRPPASTALLTLHGDDRLQRAILVRVLDAGKRLKLRDRVAGYPIVYGSVGQLMTRSGQAFLMVNRDGQQGTVPNMLFHAAAVAGTGVLAGRTADPAHFAAAALQEGPELQQQLRSTLLVRSRDGAAAALAAPVLARLATICWLAALHAAGVNLTGGGVALRLSAAEQQDAAASSAVRASTASDSEGSAAEGSSDEEGGEQGDGGAGPAGGWLSSLLQLCSSPALAEQLEAAARQLVSSGLATWVTLRMAVVNLRTRLRAEGVEVTAIISGSLPISSLLTLGGGDAARGALVKAAVNSWQKSLQALGAGPVPGLVAPRPHEFEAWRSKVVLGWPGAAAAFEAALAAGATLKQLGHRWMTAGREGPGGWTGSNPSPALAQKLKPRKRRRRELE